MTNEKKNSHRPRPKTIDVDICDECHGRATGSEHMADVARCFECARYACMCWLESCAVEGKPPADRFYFCSFGFPGSCATAPEPDDV